MTDDGRLASARIPRKRGIPGRIARRWRAVAGVCLGLTLAAALPAAAQTPGPDFSGSYKAGPPNAQAGDVVAYTIVALNNGEAAADVALYELWPAGLTPAPGSCRYDIGPDPQPGSLDLPCNPFTSTEPLWRLDLAHGARVTTTFAATVTAGTLRWPLRNCARLAWDNAYYEVCAVTTVNPIVRIYLPLVVRNWATWYLYDIYEPNDTPLQAYGPLEAGRVYDRGYIWDATDPDDYYYFVPSASVTATVALTNIPAGCDYDLYVLYYDFAHCPVEYNYYCEAAKSAQDGNTDERATFLAEAGRRYYVRVHPFSGFSSQQPYALAGDW